MCCSWWPPCLLLLRCAVLGCCWWARAQEWRTGKPGQHSAVAGPGRPQAKKKGERERQQAISSIWLLPSCRGVVVWFCSSQPRCCDATTTTTTHYYYCRRGGNARRAKKKKGKNHIISNDEWQKSDRERVAEKDEANNPIRNTTTPKVRAGFGAVEPPRSCRFLLMQDPCGLPMTRQGGGVCPPLSKAARVSVLAGVAEREEREEKTTTTGIHWPQRKACSAAVPRTVPISSQSSSTMME